MGALVVGVGDCKIGCGDDSLITYALGSCIAVIAVDPGLRVGGMLHFVLPESKSDSQNKWRYADTGIAGMMALLQKRGVQEKKLAIYLIGGAQMFATEPIFNIGKKNYLAARKVLWSSGLISRGEDVGGTASRTVRVDVSTGKVWLRTFNNASQSSNIEETLWRQTF